MKATDLLSVVLRYDINNTQCCLVTFCDDSISLDDEVDFYFNGKIHNGHVQRGRTYLAFYIEPSFHYTHIDAIIMTDDCDLIYLFIVD